MEKKEVRWPNQADSIFPLPEGKGLEEAVIEVDLLKQVFQVK